MFKKQDAPEDPFDTLPPLARQRAMELDRPYRPSRKPLFYAAVIVIVAQAVMYTVLYITRPDFVDVPEHMIRKDDPEAAARVAQQKMYSPPAAPTKPERKAEPIDRVGNTTGVVYQNLQVVE